MANSNAPRGLIPYRNMTSGPYNSGGNIYYVPASYATALFIGDPVAIVTASADISGIPAVQLATAGNGTDTPIATYGFIGAVMGIIPGGEPQIPVLQSQVPYHPASTEGYVLVCDDPEALYVVQENGNMAGATPVKGAVPGPGKNVDLVAGAGSTVNGFSGWQLGSSSLSVNALQMKVMRLLEQADNALGTNAKWLCRVNLNSLTNSAGI